METSLWTFLSNPWHLHNFDTVTSYIISLPCLNTIHTYIQSWDWSHFKYKFKWIMHLSAVCKSFKNLVIFVEVFLLLEWSQRMESKSQRVKEWSQRILF